MASAFSALLHIYLAARLLPPLDLGAAGLALAILLFGMSAILVPAPLLLRLNRLPERLADGLAWSGYLCMGVFSSLLVLTVLRDLSLLVILVAKSIGLLPGGFADWPLISAIGVLVLTALVTLLGVANARRVAKVVRVEVPIADLPAALNGFAMVQISDIHVGPTIKRNYLSAIVARVNGLKPDLIAITGDVVDGSVERLWPHVAPLADLKAGHGVFCVTGNHEYYHDGQAWVAEWRRLGMTVLLNENRVVRHAGASLLVGGVTDYSAGLFVPGHHSDAAAAAATGEPVDLKLLLAHQPRSAPAAAEAGFDLQLSGHTHGGQFWPWNLFVPLQQPFVAGLARLKRLWVYTSRGTGYWGPPLRFGAPSEITQIVLRPA